MVDARVSPVLVLIWLSILSIPVPPIGSDESRAFIKSVPGRGYCKPVRCPLEIIRLGNTSALAVDMPGHVNASGGKGIDASHGRRDNVAGRL